MSSKRPPTILVVDDDPADRFMLGGALRAAGLAVLEAASVAEGQALARQRPDLMLLDMRLPDGSGIDLCRRVKSDPQTASVLVIYLSASSVPLENEALALEGGADGFLAKPVAPPIAVAHVKAWLRLREAEELTRAAAQQWRATFDAVRDGLCLVGPSGAVLRCNRALADLLGRPFPDIVGQPFGGVFRAATGVPPPPLEARVRQTRQRQSAEWSLGDRWFRVTADPVFGKQGELLGTVHLFADITQRKQAELALAQLAALVEFSDDAIIYGTVDGIIRSWNPAAERLLGYKAEEIIGRPAAVIIPPDRAEEFADLHAGVRRGEHRGTFETVRKHKDGRLLDVALTVCPVCDAAGTVTGASVTIRDITGRKRLEEKLRQAQKMEAVGQLAGGIAHDFNNLLTIILGYSQLALTQMSLPDLLNNPLQEILKAGERAAVLTRQLLAFSRRQVLEPKVLDLNAVVTDMERMLRRLIGEDIELATHLDPDLEAVQADPGQIDQVLLNLAVNARDAMPEGGRLTIETANTELDEDYARNHPDVRPGRYALVAVTDSGTGIAPENLPQIFEPFFTTKEPGKGTGLGLSTVYGIVRQSGGHISVYSEPGHGTTFKIYLPVTQEPITVTPRLAPPLPGTETILVVEDEEPVRQFAGMALRQSGYTVLEASGGEEALRKAGEHQGPIHLLLTDVVMPGMSGRELAKHLAPLHPETKVFYFSGYTSDAIVRHGILSGDMPFLPKPFGREALARKVREILGPADREDRPRSGQREMSAS